jgi:hypothetical protein
MKYAAITTLFLLSVFATSCGQSQTNPTKGNTKSESKDTVTSSRFKDPGFFTRYEYTDATGKGLIIQNGYPRGASRYTDPDGELYGYAIFWTRIVNETDHPVELTIDFPQNPYEVPSLPGKYFTVLVPPDTMTIDKVPLYSYGLKGLESFLDTSIHKPSSLKRTINPNESSGFFVVKLSLVSEGARGGGDVLRTGLILKGQDLFYRVSTYNSTPARQPLSIIGEKEIHCGSINLKNLVLREIPKSGS